MLPSARPARRAVQGAIGAGALAGAMLFGAAATATAQPPYPPECTAAELARVMSGVTFITGNYLTEHPAVNDFFTSLKGQPKDQSGIRSRLIWTPTRKFRPTFRPSGNPRLNSANAVGFRRPRRPPDRFRRRGCGARPFGRRRQCGWCFPIHVPWCLSYPCRGRTWRGSLERAGGDSKRVFENSRWAGVCASRRTEEVGSWLGR